MLFTGNWVLPLLVLAHNDTLLCSGPWSVWNFLLLLIGLSDFRRWTSMVLDRGITKENDDDDDDDNL